MALLKCLSNITLHSSNITVNSTKSFSEIHSKRNLLKACLSGFVEWYDFGLYLYMVPIFSNLYFSSFSKYQGMIYALLIFASSYLFRPLGGILLGWVGERFNKKAVLMTSTALMLVSMLIISCLPTNDNMISTSLFLLIASRIIQGISVGGQYVSLYIFLNELSRPKYLGSTVSIGGVACGSGMLFSAFIVYIMYKFFPENQILSWIFRGPFLIGIFLSLMTLFLQRSLIEKSNSKKQFSLLNGLKKLNRFNIYNSGLLILLCGFCTSIFYFTIAYIPSIAAIHTSAINGTILGVITKIAQILTAVIGGWIYDCSKRKSQSIIWAIIFSILGVTLYIISIIFFHQFYLIIMVVIFMAFASEFLIMNMFIYLNKILDGELKLFSSSFIYNMASAVFGGLTPAILVYISGGGYIVFVPIYFMVFSVIVIFSLLFIKRNAIKNLPRHYEITI